MRHLILLAVALAVAGSVEAAETTTVPDVATLNDLRAAPLLRLEDGTECRVGLSSGGDAAGPWRVVYCLVEKHPDREGPARPTTQTGMVHRLGPVRYEVAWYCDAPRQRAHVGEIVDPRPALPTLHAGGVRLDRQNTADVRVLTPWDALITERRLLIAQVRPRTWSRFAHERFREGKSSGYWVEDEPMPAMPRFARRGMTVSTTQPAPDAPLPGDIFEVEPKSPRMQLRLQDESFVVRSEEKFPDSAPGDMLARWWVNGKLAVAPEPKRQQAMQQSRQIREPRQVNDVTIPFGLPDFLVDLKAGDRVAVQLLYSPDGCDPLISMQMLQMMRMEHSNWPWPVMTNRLEFELTPQLLAKRDNAVAPTTRPAAP